MAPTSRLLLPLPPMLRALRHRNYRLLFFGQLVSLCGVWMQITAQGWLVLRLTNSPLWLGLIAAAQSLPVLLRSLPLITQSVSMISALLLALLLFTGQIQGWHVLVAALLGGVVSAVENTAR